MPPKEAPVLVADRTISGRGIFLIPASEAYRHFYLYVNVVRKPTTDFTNSKYNPDKSEYCKIVWSRNGYVLRTDAVNFQNQLIQWSVDPTGYLASFLSCALDEITNYFDYLAPFVGATPLVTDPLNRIWVEPLKDVPDTIKIVCRGDGAIVGKLYSLKYDVSCPSATPSPKPPPDPPPVSPVPPGMGIGVSPPYDGMSDNGDSVPLPSDSIDTPPPARIRAHYRVDPGFTAGTTYFVDDEFDVPDNTYMIVLVDGATPSGCSGHTLPEFTVARSTGRPDIVMRSHNTCNLLTIVSQEFI